MKMKKLSCLILAFVLSFSSLTGCGNTDKTSNEGTQTSSSQAKTENSSESKGTVDKNQAAAEKLLLDLKGSYQELWPVVLADEYDQIWLDDSAAIVGEENAAGAVEKMSSMVTGTVMGEEAVETYTDGNGVYCCEFTEGVKEFKFDKTTISGYDSDGNEVFSHSYHYVGMEDVRGLYEYESDDADSGEFTYFCLAPDTSDTTYHIEFRYGSDLDALGKYDSGKYAYWLAAGIATDCDQTMIENSIKLFCDENLSE